MSAVDEVVIVAAKRTPIGSMLGCLSGFTAPELGAFAIQGALDEAGTPYSEIDEIYMGNVVSAGQKQAPARQAALIAGVPDSVPCTTISKVCGSSMKAIMLARDQILAGNADVVLAGGMESMSAAPYLMTKARSGMRLGHGELLDSLFVDGLEDAESGRLMGSYAQEVADRFNYSREDMDAYALESLNRAIVTTKHGEFENEIHPLTLRKLGVEETLSIDELPQKARPEKIATLKPAFKPGGTVTAANSSSMSDGGAALLLMRESRADEMACTKFARIVAQATHAQRPEEFCLTPIGAIRQVCDRANWSVQDIDLFEINEAFAVVPMLAIDQLELDRSKVNIRGGACALGHPLGASGARIAVTLIHALQQTGKRRGLATICIGGGEATAIAVELA